MTRLSHLRLFLNLPSFVTRTRLSCSPRDKIHVRASDTQNMSVRGWRWKESAIYNKMNIHLSWSLEAYSYPTFPVANNFSLSSRREWCLSIATLTLHFHELFERFSSVEVCRTTDPSCKFSYPRFELAQYSGPLLPLSSAISSSRFLPFPLL